MTPNHDGREVSAAGLRGSATALKGMAGAVLQVAQAHILMEALDSAADQLEQKDAEIVRLRAALGDIGYSTSAAMDAPNLPTGLKAAIEKWMNRATVALTGGEGM